MMHLEHYVHINNGISGIKRRGGGVWQVSGVFEIWSQHKSILQVNS